MIGRLVALLGGSPAGIQGLLYAAIAALVVCLSVTSWALLERSWRFQALADLERARGDLEVAHAQEKVLGAAVGACNAGVEEAKRAGLAGRALGLQLLAEARRLHAEGTAEVAALEALLAQPEKPGATCDDAWREIEELRRKVRAP